MPDRHQAADARVPPPLGPRSRRVKETRRLLRRRERAEARLFLVEGPKALAEALTVPDGLREVFATPAAGTTYDALRAAVRARGLAWYDAEESAIASLSDTVSPQGLVGVCRFVDVALDQLPADARTVAVCADVRDPGNAGTIIRTADAVGADAVVLAGSSVDPYNPKTVRATVGSLFHLPVVVEPDPVATLTGLRDAGLTVLAADGSGESDLFGAEVEALLATDRVAWLFGNEAWGLPAPLAAMADRRVAIPLGGRAESLNLATAAAVCLFASARARRR